MTKLVKFAVGGAVVVAVAALGYKSYTKGQTKAVEVRGCAAAPRIVSCTVRFKDSAGKPVTAKNEGAGLTAEMRSMVSKLPDGTAFTVTVEALDASGRSLPMPEASFVIRG